MKDSNNSAQDHMPLSNAAALSHFISMQESRPAHGPDHSAQTWNKRAEFWKKERENNRKGDERVDSAVRFLEQRGILSKEYDIVDIGCGPGRFAGAFAKRARSVVGLDLSEKMVSHGMEYIQSLGLSNARLCTCDFQTLDIEKEGYKNAFDLVFSSMTPAIHGMNGLMKSMEMSRGYCCNITHIYGHNRLRNKIMKEVFGKETTPQWSGKWFYSLFNVLFLMGYYPETSYETRHQELWVQPNGEYVEAAMEHMLPEEECTKENAAKILSWLKSHANTEGVLKEATDSCYGRILWDVRNKTERPDYGAMEQEVS